ncbi:uncharacterized protein [Venturia canescens]|uniref:uncharacterized protein isoform X2 n=1 Tax=Venturia canescens TaxID=32260 RepID=UPI001C9D24A0|nr:uncharacterized protein LOC122419417 isoform X2 [Venturia canescens]
MRFGNLPRRFLAHFITLLVLLVRLDNAENLGFYQDVEPERGMDANYEEMARYLEAEKLANMRDVSRSRSAPDSPWGYAEYLYEQRQKEKKLLEAFLENPSVLDALELREQAKERSMIPQLPMGYDVPEDLEREIPEAEVVRPYSRPDPLSERFEDVSSLKIPYAKSIFRNEKPRYVHPAAPDRLSRVNEFIDENYPEQTSAEERLLKIEGKLMELNRNRVFNNDEDVSAHNPVRETPQFTYRFDPPKMEERPFAVKPNDPRYYEKDDPSTEPINEKTTTKHQNIITSSREFQHQDQNKEQNHLPPTDPEYSTENVRTDKFSIMKIVLPDNHRLTEDDSVIVSSSRLMTNDIYFIAIVAGCSAAAMFALVLISLTWCRLQRGAKAAADIEYPAYGVTGPNKDISPSGDQRLAHSAQMYHFQHQKQQIIAMEKTAASRDPGSVSEAESDEENEEGDYTVYECPGLASAGEMEVKNPMFHADPTPASPQIHKEEDHI